MSALDSKINSYALERGIEFDQTFSLSPTRTGTNPLGNFTQNVTSNIVYQPTVGPIGGSGSWRFLFNSTAAVNSAFIASSSSTTELLGNADNNFSFGFWFNFNAVPTNSSTNLFFTFGATAGNGVTVSVGGATSSSARKIVSVFNGGSFTSPNTITLGNWNYYAFTRNGSAISIYLNGSTLVSTSSGGTTTASVLTFGRNGATSSTTDVPYNISNYYFAPLSVIGPTEISEIWTAGSTSSSTNVTFTTTPATASALQTQPTIAVTAGDNTQITTSILVSAEFPSNIVAGGDRNVNVEISQTLNASTELINNVDISTGTDISWSAAEMTASADIVEGFFARQAMLASAVSGDHGVYVTPSYYSLVKSASPLFYTNFEDSTITNFGSWNNTTYNVGSTVSKNQVSGGDMSMIAGGESWKFTGTTNNAPNYVEIIPENANQTLFNLLSQDFTVEYWFKPTAVNCGVGLVFGNYRIVFMKDTRAGYANYSQTYKNSMAVYVINVQPWQIGGETFTTKLFAAAAESIIFNDWNHIVLKSTPISPENGNTIVALYINGSYAAGGSFKQNNWQNSSVNWDEIDIMDSSWTWLGKESSFSNAQLLFDEFAIYDQELTNSEIIDHYSFIYNQDPNRNISATPMEADAFCGEHVFTVSSNVNYPETSVTASALAVTPSVVASKVITLDADPMLASATNTDVTISWGWTIYATPATSYAESANAFALNTMYYDYVQANALPYRYVTFDGTNSYLDYGSDEDYSVAPVSGGTIVSPEFGINGKSAKIDGSTYTDGVILKESVWNDNWGTGQNTYHSSFWMQKAEDDNSTGLRVLWNLNGYADNQHVILFQYQGKLHMQFNNGSGTHLDAVTTNNIDLFDGQRHFVVVAFDHTNNNNNTVHLYVDSVLVLTVNLGSYTGTTVNGTTFVGPNDEANNHPRLGIGCLITSFASTALPVVPTNIKIYVDEIVWAKTKATQNLVNGLYAAMPDKENEIFTAESLTASANIVNPSLSIEINIATDSLLAVADITEQEIVADRSIVAIATPFLANALFSEASRKDEANVISDIFLASASLDGGSVKITIPGGPLLATATLAPNITGKVNVYLGSDGEISASYTIDFNTQKSAYVNYVIKESSISSIARVREIK